SSGLEPNFLLAYTRYIHRSDGSKEALLYINKVLKEKLGGETMKRIEKVLLEKGSLKDIEGIPEKVKRVFVVALDIDPMDHLLMQDAFQRYVDNNISKTINMPKDYTVDDVLGVYLESLKTCVRGLTVYRDGSLQTQVLTKVKKLKTKEAPVVQFFVVDDKLKIRPKPRKESLRSVTRKYRRRDGTTYITVSFDDTGEAVEIFLSNGTETAEVIGRLASIALRAGVSSEEILEQLSKVRGNYVKGLADEIKKAIDDFAKLWGETVREEKEIDREKFILANNLKWYEGYYIDDEGNVYCPICLSKNSLVKQEGCTSCKVCGWSKCES
ncbi:MAG: ribonucleoside-diphosphate reductase, adenosylcobalamin-dependent, partial [Thermotogaceae bacterium]|nr:ribonucleoside-diphosphate reductase, adenosylcobalamin-dependent [Thermotogaceae bacterium]